MNAIQEFRRAAVLGIWGLAPWIGNPVSAAITDLDASVMVTVQELIDGQASSVNRDERALGVEGAELPLVATAEIASTELGGPITSSGLGISEFHDPARQDQANPGEFAVEVACFSHAERVAFRVFAKAEERRDVLFTTADNPIAPPEIGFGSDSSRVVESRVFLSGALVLWRVRGNSRLDEVAAKIGITVLRDDQATPLFLTSLEVSGSAPGEDRSISGPIVVERLGVQELAAFGLDEDTTAVLQALENGGILTTLVIPRQEHAYTYRVFADEPLSLGSKLDLDIRSVPGGSGVAATLGKPFSELTRFFELALPGIDGESIQRAINKAIAGRDLGPADPAAATTPRSRGILCGAFGMEAASLLLFGLVISGRPVRYRGLRGRWAAGRPRLGNHARPPGRL